MARKIRPCAYREGCAGRQLSSRNICVVTFFFVPLEARAPTSVRVYTVQAWSSVLLPLHAPCLSSTTSVLGHCSSTAARRIRSQAAPGKSRSGRVATLLLPEQTAQHVLGTNNDYTPILRVHSVH